MCYGIFLHIYLFGVLWMIKKVLIMNFAVIVLLGILTLTISNTVTVLTESKPIVRHHCIVIDPGHGGVDGGATSVHGKLESQLNLEISLRLRDLCHLLGINTVMIRTGDRSIHSSGQSIAQKKISDLKNRVQIVNGIDKSILVSIHQNYFTNGKYHGAQVFYANDPESKDLAIAMQTSLVTNLNPESNRKAKKASGIYLMEHIKRPGILIECGFLSNDNEAKRLTSDVYQKKICIVIASVLSTYINEVRIS